MSAADLGRLTWSHRTQLVDPEQRPAAIRDLAWDATEWAGRMAGYATGVAGAAAALEAAAAGGTIIAGGTATAVAAPLVVGTAAGTERSGSSNSPGSACSSSAAPRPRPPEGHRSDRVAPRLTPRATFAPIPDPQKARNPRASRGFARWARLDSNQGPTDYESAALTN